MNRLLIILTFVLAFTSYNFTSPKIRNMEDKRNETGEPLSHQDTTPKVTGIGGIFFFADNPEETRAWYSKNLGLEVNLYGSSFEFRNANRPDEINYLQWSPFKKGNEYFAPSKKEFMINYRVQNIEGLITKLKNNGVTILDSMETYDYGKFIHIMDAEGNKIELWEPVDSVFTAMGGKTTK
jgi:predicted enzyme related to lactoylglutathione lyase